MSYVLTCPNCGPREVTDFGFAGVQREWWVHRSGCGDWFIAERDTRTNEVLFTALPDEAAART